MRKPSLPQRNLLRALAAGDVVLFNRQRRRGRFTLRCSGQTVHENTLLGAHRRDWIGWSPHRYYEITDAGREAYEGALNDG